MTKSIRHPRIGQQTNQTPDAADDERLAPEHGWDNPDDVRKAKGIARDMQFAFTANERGLEHARRIAFDFYEQGVSAHTAIDLLMRWADPQLARGDFALEFEKVYEHATYSPGLRSFARAAKPDDGESWLALDDDDSDDWMEGGTQAWPRPLVYDVKQNTAKLSETFLAHRPQRLISSNETLFSLGADGVWREMSAIALSAEIRATDPALNIDTGRIQLMVRGVHIERFTAARPFEWLETPFDAATPSNLVLFANGILDTETGELRPHDGRLFATGLPEFSYDPEAACPIWGRFITEVLDESFHPTLQEYLGYLMVPDNSFQKFLVLSGARRAGKSTIANVAESLIGRELCTSRTLNDLGSDFGLEGLLTAKLLAVPDASDSELSRRGATLDRLKSITGGDSISINRKNQRIVTAKIPARVLLACNRIPKFLDDSGALAARMIVIKFERSFEGREDRELFAKLHAELPGIANWALAGLARLRANGGKFTIGKKGIAAVRAVEESQSPALRFAKACLSVTGNADDFAPLDSVFGCYESWCVDESLGARERRNRDDFKNDLVAALETRGVRYTRRRWREKGEAIDGSAPRHRGFSGLRLAVLLARDAS